MLGFGKNLNLSRREYYADLLARIEQAPEKLQEYAAGFIQHDLLYLRQVASSIQNFDDGSALEGLSQDGYRWAYEFVEESSGPLRQRLWRSEDCELLYSDERWVVTGQFIPIDPGRGRHEVSFYDASDLLLSFRLSVPNYVMRVQWSSEREQFFLVTTQSVGNSTMVKWPDDIAQALVVVDPSKRSIERIRLLREKQLDSRFNIGAPDENWNGVGRLGITEWRGDTIHLQFPSGTHSTKHGGLRFFSDPKFLKEEFSDIRVITPEGDRGLVSGARVAEERSGLHREGLSQFAQSAFPGAPPFEASLVHIKEGEQAGTHLIRTTTEGGIFDLNLNTLRSRYFRIGDAEVRQSDILENGILCGLVGDEIVFVSESGEVRRNIPSEEEGQETQVGFTGKGAVVATRESEDSGRFSFVEVSADGEFTKERFVQIENKSMDWRLLPERKSLGQIGGGFSEGRFWKEHDWVSGAVKGRAIEDVTGKGIYAHDRKFGIAPTGWEITTTCVGASTGGREYDVEVRQMTGKLGGRLGGKSSAVRGQTPLVLELESGDRKRARILSCGLTGAELLSVDVATGDWEVIETWNWNPHETRPLYSEFEKWFLVPSQNGYHVFSPFGNEPGKIVFEILLRGHTEYAVILPDLDYAGSPGCEAFLNLSGRGSEVRGATFLAPWKNRPAQILETLGGNSSEVETLRYTTERWLRRIEVDVTQEVPSENALPTAKAEPRPGLFQSDASLRLPVSVRAGSEAVTRVQVFVNGVVAADLLDSGEQVDRGTSRVLPSDIRLSRGQNWIEVVASDSRKRSGVVDRFRVLVEEETTQAQRYVVSIGISDFQIERMKLDFGASDATAIAELFRNGARERTELLLLRNEQVDKNCIGRIEEFLSQAGENDDVIVFCAGHGILDEDLDFLFPAHDFDPERAVETSLALSEIVGAINSSQSRKRLLLLDTCQSGLVGESDEVALEPNNRLPEGVGIRFIEEFFQMPGMIQGLNIIGASRASEEAMESKEIGGGFFTAAIREGIGQLDADLDNDGAIRVSELRDFLSRRVPELTRKSGIPDGQLPSVVAFERDQDFVLSR